MHGLLFLFVKKTSAIIGKNTNNYIFGGYIMKKIIIIALVVMTMFIALKSTIHDKTVVTTISGNNIVVHEYIDGDRIK